MPRKRRSPQDYAREYLTELVRNESADHTLRLEAARLLISPTSEPDYSLLSPELAASVSN